MPDLKITGENYEVKGWKSIAVTLIGQLRTVCFLILFGGETIIGFLGGMQSQPEMVQDAMDWIKNNKMQFGLVSFFLTSMIQTSLMQTGAFEIYINGNLHYSKLQTNKMPQFEDIQAILAKYNISV